VGAPAAAVQTACLEMMLRISNDALDAMPAENEAGIA